MKTFNRRSFVLMAALAATATFSACGGKSLGDELLGYWLVRDGKRIYAMLKISRNGDKLLMTVAEYGFAADGGDTPKEKNIPLDYSNNLQKFGISSPLGFIPVERVGNQVFYMNSEFDRSTEDQYNEFLKTPLPKIRF